MLLFMFFVIFCIFCEKVIVHVFKTMLNDFASE